MKMHEKKLKRFNVYSKIANVLFVIVVIGGALLTLLGTLGAIYLNVTDFDLAEAANYIFDNELPGAELILSDDMNISYGVVYMIVLNMAIAAALMAFAVKAVANMFKHTVREGTPFNPKSVRCIKLIGDAFIVYAGAICLLSIITGLLYPSPKWNVSINVCIVLIGVLVLSLGEMFEFGMNLQQDSESIL